MRIILSIIFSLLSALCAASLTPVETRIRAEVVADKQAQLALLKKIVNMNSGTNNINGVVQVGEVLRPEFEKLGFHTYWVEEPKNFHRAPTLVAARQGKQGKRVLLIGHLDTVFPAASPFQKFELKQNSAKGPGVVDDKGGVVVILCALNALAKAHVLDNTSITVVLTGDEEDSGKPASISRKPLVDAARKSDVALDFEEAVTMDTASIARRGISAWRVTATGVEAHSSTIFQKESGAGAIFELARILNTMRTELRGYKNSTYNPGLVLGGTTTDYDAHASAGTAFGKSNVIAKAALAIGDFRYLTLAEREKLKTHMRAIVSHHLPRTQAVISFQDGIPAMPPTSANLALLNQYSKVSADLGHGKLSVLGPNDRGAGDISYAANLVPANLVGLGPMGWDTHSTGETVDLSSLSIQTERAALLIYSLTH